MKKLFKTTIFLFTGMLIMNSCKDDSDNGGGSDNGPIISPDNVEQYMVKVEGDGTLPTFRIGRYVITQSQWDAVKNGDFYYGIRTEGDKEKYDDKVSVPKIVIINGKEVEVLTEKDTVKEKDITIYHTNAKMRLKAGAMWSDRLQEQQSDQLAAFRGENMPMVNVTWIDAVRFCNALSRKEGKDEFYKIYFHYQIDEITKTESEGTLTEDGKFKVGKDIFDIIKTIDDTVYVVQSDTSDILDSIRFDPTFKKGYRLPTDAEWLFAAKGGKNSNGYIYSGSNNIDQVAWYNDNSSHRMHAVGAKQPNELGLYDMSGNVFEWSNDLYSDDSGISEDEYIIRGGCWARGATMSEISEYKNKDNKEKEKRKISFWNYTLGFRVVLSE